MFMASMKHRGGHREKRSTLPRTRHPTHGRPPARDTRGCMTRKADLREFLRVRRARLRPEDVGIQTIGQRRVPGLRREEIASLAGMSVDYYIRLEQGRDLTPSQSVLDALARALRLDEVEREHLYSLVRPAAAPDDGSAAGGPAAIRPGVRLLLDGIHTPAFGLGRRLDILATNRMARAMLADFDARRSATETTPVGSSSTRRPVTCTSTGRSSPARTSRSCAETPAATRATP